MSGGKPDKAVSVLRALPQFIKLARLSKRFREESYKRNYGPHKF